METRQYLYLESAAGHGRGCCCSEECVVFLLVALVLLREALIALRMVLLNLGMVTLVLGMVWSYACVCRTEGSSHSNSNSVAYND